MQEKLIGAQENRRKIEIEKINLMDKYKEMCKDIISKRDYEIELKEAREEL